MAGNDQDEELTPEQQLLVDIQTEHLVAPVTGRSSLSPQDRVKARQDVRRLLESHGLLSKEQATLASAQPTRRQLRIEPIATLAAADAVKSVIPWEAGDIRLLASPMRSDLAVEVLVDESRRDDFEGVVFFVRVTDASNTVAIFPDESPVFCQVESQGLVHGATLSLEWAAAESLGTERLTILKRSQRNLRDPSSLDRYDELIGKIEEA